MSYVRRLRYAKFKKRQIISYGLKMGLSSVRKLTLIGRASLRNILIYALILKTLLISNPYTKLLELEIVRSFENSLVEHIGKLQIWKLGFQKHIPNKGRLHQRMRFCDD